MANTTNNTRNTATNNATKNTANAKGNQTMKATTVATFKTTTGNVVMDTNKIAQVVSAFGTRKITFEEATAPANKEAWKIVKDFVLRPEDMDGMGLVTLRGLKTEEDFDDMCDYFLEIGVKSEYIEASTSNSVKRDTKRTEKQATKTENQKSNGSNKNPKQPTRFSWENLKNYKNSDGSPMDTAKATFTWFKDNFPSMLEEAVDDVKSTGQEAIDHITKTEKKARKSMFDSFDKEDYHLVNILRGLYHAVATIKRHNAVAYSTLTKMYAMDGAVRTTEIHKILVKNVEHCYAFFNADDAQVEEEINEYFEAGQELLAYACKLRLWIRKMGRQVKKFLGVNAEGTIAHKVYRILKAMFNIVIYGGKVVIEVATVALSGILSFAIFVGGKAFEGIAWLVRHIKQLIVRGKDFVKKADPLADEDAQVLGKDAVNDAKDGVVIDADGSIIPIG